MRLSSLLLVVVLAAARAASAQQPATTTTPPPLQGDTQRAIDEKARAESLPGATAEAPRLTAPTITMAEAVTQAVTNQPQIKLGIESVNTRVGSVQREGGRFDWRLILTPNLDYNNLALDPGTRKGESDRRLKFAI